MIISADGIIIRTPVKDEISIQKRSTQGVTLKELGRGDKVVAIACLD